LPMLEKTSHAKFIGSAQSNAHGDAKARKHKPKKSKGDENGVDEVNKDEEETWTGIAE